MDIIIKINTDNAAFADDSKENSLHISEQIESYILAGRRDKVNIYDINGNAVGNIK